MSKLALQAQQFDKARRQWMLDFVRDSGSKWAMLIEPPEGGDPFGGMVKVLARAPLPGGDSEEQGYVLRGRKGAEAYFERLRGFYDARRYVDVWLPANEAAVGERIFRLMLSEFTVRWVELMEGDGWETATCAFSVGWPDYNVAHIVELLPALLAGHYIATHQYSAPTMMDRAEHHTLRHRWLYDTMRSVARPGQVLPRLMIGECGIDGGVAPVYRAKTGWRTHCDGSFERYLPQLQWFDGEIAKDDYVEAAFIFLFGGREGWRDFDLDKGNARKLAKYMASTNVAPAEPLPEQEQGTLPKLLEKLRWWCEEMQRMHEAGDLERANRIRLSMIKLLSRMEGMAKEI